MHVSHLLRPLQARAAHGIHTVSSEHSEPKSATAETTQVCDASLLIILNQLITIVFLSTVTKQEALKHKH